MVPVDEVLKFKIVLELNFEEIFNITLSKKLDDTNQERFRTKQKESA